MEGTEYMQGQTLKENPVISVKLNTLQNYRSTK